MNDSISREGGAPVTGDEQWSSPGSSTDDGVRDALRDVARRLGAGGSGRHSHERRDVDRRAGRRRHSSRRRASPLRDRRPRRDPVSELRRAGSTRRSRHRPTRLGPPTRTFSSTARACPSSRGSRSRSPPSAIRVAPADERPGRRPQRRGRRCARGRSRRRRSTAPAPCARPDEHDPFGADRIQHGAHVVDPMLERRRALGSIGSESPVPRRSRRTTRPSDAQAADRCRPAPAPRHSWSRFE